MGSGTTGYAALSLGRLFAGFDLVEEYVSSADQRLHALIGEKDGFTKETL